MIETFLLPILVVVNQRSMVDVVPVLVSKSHTVKKVVFHLQKKEDLVTFIFSVVSFVI